MFALAVASAAERPNILLMVSDDQGWWDVAVNGNPDIKTPTLDRLAGEGVNLTRFYAAPVCSPTRAGLMTGRYALRTGVYNTRFGGDSLRLSETTLADVLKEQGYRTGIFGKWHLGGHAAYQPAKRGFDEALTFTSGHHERYNYPELELNGEPVASRGHITDIFADSAAAFLKESDQPFFAYVPFNVPHSPHYIDDEYIEPYLAKGLELREARIYGMITHMDEAVARLLAAVDEAGKRDNTLVIFLGDNGGVSKHTRLWLRGGKASPFEGGLRVPAFFRWPGKIPAGRSSDAMTSHLDILPTLCAILGVDPPRTDLDGKSLWPLLEKGSGESPHERLFHVWDRHRPNLKRGWSVTEPRWKLTYEGLYDLEADRGEKHDVSKENPAVAKRLRASFEAWLHEVTKDLDFMPVPIKVTAGEPVEIQASWARVDGTHTNWASPGTKQSGGPDPLGDPAHKTGVNYTFAGYDWDTIDGWSKPGEGVSWRLNVVDPGEYEVVAAYGCEPADAGGELRLEAGGKSLDVTIAATPQHNVYETRTLGMLRLAKGPAELKVTVVSAPGKELMSLNKIWLRRAE